MISITDVILVLAFLLVVWLFIRVIRKQDKQASKSQPDDTTQPKPVDTSNESMTKKTKRIIFWLAMGALLLILVLTVGLPLQALILIVTIGIALAVFYYLLRWLFAEMAKRDILVTFRTDGSIKAIMKGEACIRYLIKVENHIIDPQDFDIFKSSTDNLKPYAMYLSKQAKRRKEEDPSFTERKLKDPDDWMDKNNPEFTAEFERWLIKENSPTTLEKLFGVVWVGFPPYRVFSYRFRWIKYGQKELPDGKISNETVMIPREELISWLYYRYPVYGIPMDHVETGAGSFAKKQDGQEQPKGHREERIQIKLDLVIETATCNPQKTLFRAAGLPSAGEWFNGLAKLIRDRVRKWVGQTSYDAIITTKKEEVEGQLDKIRDQINLGIVLYEKGESEKDKDSKPIKTVSAIYDYGQEIVKISLVNIDLQEPKLQDSINEIFQAEQDLRRAEKVKDTKIVLAEGVKVETAAPLLGEAEGYAAIVNAGGEKMKIAKEVGNIKVLNLGGGGFGNIVSLPESLLEGKESKPAPKKPETGETETKK